MSQHEITEWTCDNCTEPGLPAQIPIHNPMPDQWVNLIAKCDLGYLFELELCTDCYEAVRAALLSRNPMA
jgi:hypothetical protein